MLKFICKSPTEYSADQLSVFEELVLESGEVSPVGLTGRIANAHRLIFCHDGRRTVGIAGVKRPTDRHRKHVSEGSGIELPEAEWPYELGWTYVPPWARGAGISKSLVEMAVRGLDASLFATSHTENSRMHATLKRHGFVEAGTPYPSDRPKIEIQLFLLPR